MTRLKRNNIIIKKYTYDGLGRLSREDNADLQISQLESTITYYKNRSNLFGQLVEYINKDYSKDEQYHCFDRDSFDELEFYNYMMSYELEQKQYEGYPNETDLLASLKAQKINTYTSQRNSLVRECEQYSAKKCI